MKWLEDLLVRAFERCMASREASVRMEELRISMAGNTIVCPDCYQPARLLAISPIIEARLSTLRVASGPLGDLKLRTVGHRVICVHCGHAFAVTETGVMESPVLSAGEFKPGRPVKPQPEPDPGKAPPADPTPPGPPARPRPRMPLHADPSNV